jgi:hypothetical protein
MAYIWTSTQLTQAICLSLSSNDYHATEGGYSQVFGPTTEHFLCQGCWGAQSDMATGHHEGNDLISAIHHRFCHGLMEANELGQGLFELGAGHN